MRRTGTTILFDGFVRDPRFVTLYEPLNRISEEPLLGGGSGVHQVDLYNDLRPIRDRFLHDHPHVSPLDLNYGGPTRAEVEVDGETLPSDIEAYVAAVAASPGPKVTKYVRLSTRIPLLHEVSPHGVLLWTLRDPRAVARSYLHGRNDRFAEQYHDAEDWFGRTSNFNRWSIGALSDAILAQTPALLDAPPTDLERVLIVWKHIVSSMARDAPTSFRDRSLRLRHEDFCAAPTASMQAIFGLLGMDPSAEVCAWLEGTVVPAKAPRFVDDERWDQVFDRLDMTALVAEQGY